MTWKLTDEPNSTFIYELNEKGSNIWFANVQPGFDNNGKRGTEDYLHKIASKMSHAEDMYDLLKDILNSNCRTSEFNDDIEDLMERINTGERK
jgi:hypothetical protein